MKRKILLLCCVLALAACGDREAEQRAAVAAQAAANVAGGGRALPQRRITHRRAQHDLRQQVDRDLVDHLLGALGRLGGERGQVEREATHAAVPRTAPPRPPATPA